MVKAARKAEKSSHDTFLCVKRRKGYIMHVHARVCNKYLLWNGIKRLRGYRATCTISNCLYHNRCDETYLIARLCVRVFVQTCKRTWLQSENTRIRNVIRVLAVRVNQYRCLRLNRSMRGWSGLGEFEKLGENRNLI